MPFRTSHDVDIGLRRLLSAPKDVVPPGPGGPRRQDEAPKAYGALFSAYLTDMLEVFQVASEIWEADIDGLTAGGMTVGQAIESKLDEGAAGPANHPAVVWLVRRYWLECVALGARHPPADRVLPEVFLLEWLADAGHTDFVTLLTAMPYWPIGLDENGNWC